MAFQDIATATAAKLGLKAKVAAVILMLSTFAWSMISVGIATTTGTWSIETFIIVTMLNAAEMVGASWILTPVINPANDDGDITRKKLKKAIQILWGSTVCFAYVAEFTIVALGSWEKLANLPINFLWQFCRVILTVTIAIITAFGTDFSLTVLMASTTIKHAHHASHRSALTTTSVGTLRPDQN